MYQPQVMSLEASLRCHAMTAGSLEAAALDHVLSKYVACLCTAWSSTARQLAAAADQWWDAERQHLGRMNCMQVKQFLSFLP